MLPEDPQNFPFHPHRYAPSNDAHTFTLHRDLLAYLHSHGHFHSYDEDHFIVEEIPWTHVRDLPPDHEDILDAITSWQSFRPNLKQDGIFGPVSMAAAAAEMGSRCGLPDIMPRAQAAPAWPAECKHQLTTSHEIGRLPYTGDAEQSIDQAWDKGIGEWMTAADLTLSRVTPGSSARVHARAERLGRYILAWSELATGNCSSRLTQAYNSQMRWDWHLLWTTICHEVGHAIGIGHGGRGIMQPAHDPSVDGLGSWDVDQVVARYDTANPPAPGPGPWPATWIRAIMQLYDAVDDVVATFDITRRPGA